MCSIKHYEAVGPPPALRDVAKPSMEALVDLKDYAVDYESVTYYDVTYLGRFRKYRPYFPRIWFKRSHEDLELHHRPMACFTHTGRLITSHKACRGLIEDMRAQIPQLLDRYIRNITNLE